MARLIVVSNRVAIPSHDGASQAGGLAVAVRSLLKRHPGMWFGWSGGVSAEEDVVTKTIVRGGMTYVVTDLTDADYQEYYNGFANRVLWPILHYRLDLAEFSRRDLSGYLRVNEHFAAQLHNVLQPDDVIWVHDYHLMPLAKMLRDRGHHNRIGFFLHVPFPPPEIITALPNHERLIPQLSAYDLVGFQTKNDATNFARYFEHECRLHEARRAYLPIERPRRAHRRLPDRHRDRRVQPAGAALGALPVRAERAGQPRRARHDHRRRPARLFQGPRRSAWMPSSASSTRLSGLARAR